MKSFFTLLFASLFVVTNAFTQRIPANKPFIVKATSTECNVCGLRAWTDFKDVVDKYGKDAVVMAVHPLDESQLFSNTAMEIMDNKPSFFGTPSLFINEEFHFNDWFIGIRDFIGPFQERRVLVHPEVDFQIKGNELSVEVNMEFLHKTNRPHYVSAYVVEDHVRAFQNNRLPDDLHSKVLRTHLGENTFGVLLSETDILANQKFTNTFTLELDPEWNIENIEIATVIWEKRGETYHVINSNKALESSFSTSVNILEQANVQLSLRPTILSNISTVIVDLPTVQTDLDVMIVNTLGQSVKTIFTGNLPQGVTNFDLNRNDFSASGLYFLVIEKDGSRLVEKVVVK